MHKNFVMIAKTLAGLEDVLAEELINLGADNLEIGKRMVSFEGNNELLYKANIHCRTALRILVPIHTFKARNADEIYKEIKDIDWRKYMSENNTFAIDSVVFSTIFTHSKFVAYRTKDGLVDFFTKKVGKRPSVSTSNPDILINIHIAHDRCSVSLDSSGESLHKRGYRAGQTDAPLSEVLAAGMILKTGWKGNCDFVDPMCGSGTLLIEAALIALNIPPGIYREGFAFEKWPNFDKELFEDLYNDDSNEKEFKYNIYGYDLSGQAIAIASENIKNAGLSKHIKLEVKAIQKHETTPAANGIIVTNPPYGERLKVNNIFELYESIGERMKHVFTGYTVWILSSEKELLHKIGLKPSAKMKLINGALECEFRKYEIFEGKRDQQKIKQSEN